jgi:hypothetical protein
MNDWSNLECASTKSEVKASLRLSKACGYKSVQTNFSLLWAGIYLLPYICIIYSIIIIIITIYLCVLSIVYVALPID